MSTVTTEDITTEDAASLRRYDDLMTDVQRLAVVARVIAFRSTNALEIPHDTHEHMILSAVVKLLEDVEPPHPISVAAALSCSGRDLFVTG